MALVALGYRHLSMSPSSIGPVKAMITALDAGEAARGLEAFMARSDGAVSMRQHLRRFASEHKIPV